MSAESEGLKYGNLAVYPYLEEVPRHELCCIVDTEVDESLRGADTVHPENKLNSGYTLQLP